MCHTFCTPTRAPGLEGQMVDPEEAVDVPDEQLALFTEECWVPAGDIGDIRTPQSTHVDAVSPCCNAN